MAHTLHVVLTTTELDDADFIVTTLGDHFSHNGSASNNWSADVHVIAIGDQQNAIKSNGFASSDFQFLDLQVFTWGDFVLLAGSDMKEYTLPEGVTERPKFPVIQKKQPSSENPAGEWNKVKITVQDGVVDVYVNDVHQNTGTGLVKEGNIGLQSEGKEILFRNLVLTKM